MKTKITISFLAGAIATIQSATACTGITLTAADKSFVLARTVDWSGSEMDNLYVISPRDHTEQSLLPDGSKGGMKFTSKYGFVGLGMQRPEFIVDGTNEAGLSAALFYFPDYGKYVPYSSADNANTLADFQVVSWILSNFSSIDEVKSAIDTVNVVNIDPTASTVHWRIAEASGRVVVMEIIDGIPTFYENPLGTIANSPEFTWHLTNLDNYINLQSGTIAPTVFGPIKLQSLSHGTGLLGLPGDFSSPSRFVRASFFKNYSITQPDAAATIKQAFHILNNFDVPFGTTQAAKSGTFDMPSATQWTIATDITNRKIYYHTMYNRTIRRIDMNTIDFETVPFQSHPLDTARAETVFDVAIDRE